MPRGCMVNKRSAYLFLFSRSPWFTLWVFVMVTVLSLSSHWSVVGHMFDKIKRIWKAVPLLEVPCNGNIPRLLIAEWISLYWRGKRFWDAYPNVGLAILLICFSYFKQCPLCSLCDAELFWTVITELLLVNKDRTANITDHISQTKIKSDAVLLFLKGIITTLPCNLYPLLKHRACCI